MSRKKYVKYFKLNPEVVRDAEGGGCRFLSERTQQLVLPLVEMQRWQTRWEGQVTQDEIDAWVAQAVYEIQSENNDCLAECIDYPPSIDAVSWFPGDPYKAPNIVPPGYVQPPFTVVKPTDIGLIALGLAVGDVITDLTRIPPVTNPLVVPAGGWPGFSIQFVGREIELHFLQIPQGGVVVINTDDGERLETLDLSKDILSLPVETVSVVTHQIEFPFTGPHKVEVTFYPWINDEFPFINFGGGIRYFTVCGQFEGFDVDVRQNQETPCILEKTIDGVTWVPWADISLCAGGTRPPKPTGGEYRVYDDKLQWSSDGETWTDTFQPPDNTPQVRPPSAHPGSDDAKRCLAAANAVRVLDEFYKQTYGALAAGMSNSINTLSNFLTDVNGVLINLVFPYWESSVLGAWLFEPQYRPTNYTAPSLDTTAKDALECLLYCNSSVDSGGIVHFDYGAVRDNVIDELGVNPGTAIWSELLYIQAEGLDAAGGTTSVTSADCDCPECQDEPICQTWLNGNGPGIWSVYAPYGPSYPARVGHYHATTDVFGGNCGGTSTAHYLGIEATPTPGQYERLSVHFKGRATRATAGDGYWIYINGSLVASSSEPPLDSVITYAPTGGFTISGTIQIRIDAGCQSCGITAPDAPYSGPYALITEIELCRLEPGA